MPLSPSSVLAASVRIALVLIVLIASACGDDSGPSSGDTSEPDGADTAVPGAQVCALWNDARADLREGQWSGSVSTCDAGAWDAPGPQNTLALVNLYRAMASLPPVALSPAKSADAQECALMMHANAALNHRPPASWRCYSEAGARAASLSNLATSAGVLSVDLYMVDTGVPNLGHRRWILSNTLGPIGIGSTSDWSCLHAIAGQGDAGARWTAWPPPGGFPIQAANTLSWTTLDAAGWSIQSDDLRLSGAQVTVSRNGELLPIRVNNQLDPGFGSAYGISITPDGWQTQAGSAYRVQVRGLLEDLDYTVNVVDCDDF